MIDITMSQRMNCTLGKKKHSFVGCVIHRGTECILFVTKVIANELFSSLQQLQAMVFRVYELLLCSCKWQVSSWHAT